MIARVMEWPEIRGNLLHWTAVNAGCPTIPAHTVISQCWAFERANVTNLSLVYDFGPTSDQPIGTTEPFSIDLLTLFPNDGEYRATIATAPDTYTVDYEVVGGVVV
jgi:hypothetical protein